MATVVLSFFLIDNLRERRSVPLASQELHGLKIRAAHQLQITALDAFTFFGGPEHFISIRCASLTDLTNKLFISLLILGGIKKSTASCFPFDTKYSFALLLVCILW